MKIICEHCENEMRCVCDKCEPDTLKTTMSRQQHEQLHNICGEDLLCMASRLGYGGCSTSFLQAIADRTEAAYKLGFVSGHKKGSK
jgi:hypothetical protein